MIITQKPTDAPRALRVAAGGRVTAVLGPTNTGKTFLAMERMLAHETGMIGFPLRLLARENYEKVVRLKGEKAVALVTGEEKILPPSPRYWVCTVESMPLDRQVRFLCVDEIQLAADPERGHIFTDRLLHARGIDETMFLGSDMARGLIQKLVPRVELISRPRFSSLTYAGHKKLTRLPPRSAIVAFSVTDVYAMAEMVRRTRGGTAVVMGALSPRTRNAQVAMYQAGDVDYLVATDAIGMGLNMDVDHVWFARLSKFDGVQPRRLRAPEVAQIAGRAGRHLSDGTFGTTWDCPPMDEEQVEAVESHTFPPLTHLMWRNADLEFRSVADLLRSLEARAPVPELIRVREVDDQLALQALSREADIAAMATRPATVALLWEVCQIPDFRKVLSDAHTRLLAQVFRHLTAPAGRLPTDWVAGQVDRLDRTEGDIDALVARIAHVRTWTYVSHRADWMADPAHWQERTRAIEDRLSDALHERLTQRFVDKRSAGLVKSLRDGRELMGAVDRAGTVLVEGHAVGELEGLRFTLDADVAPEDQRAVMTAARKALKDEISSRVQRIDTAEDKDLALADDGTITWEGAPLGKLAGGESDLRPAVRVLHDDLLDGTQRDRVKARLETWVQAHIRTVLAPLFALLEAPELTGPARGIAFQLAEALGDLPRVRLESLITDLSKEQRYQLAKLGVRLGFSHVFLPVLTKPKAVALRAMLWSIRHQGPLPAPVPPPGRVSIPSEGIPTGLFAAVGYPKVGPRAVRIDMLDRLEKELATRSKAGPLTEAAIADLTQLLGCSMEDLAGVLTAMGWRTKQIRLAPKPPEPTAPPVVDATPTDGAPAEEAGPAEVVEAEAVEANPAEATAVDASTMDETAATDAVVEVAEVPVEVEAGELPDAPTPTAAEGGNGTEPVVEAAATVADGGEELPLVTVWVRRPRRPEGHQNRRRGRPGDRDEASTARGPRPEGRVQGGEEGGAEGRPPRHNARRQDQRPGPQGEPRRSKDGQGKDGQARDGQPREGQSRDGRPRPGRPDGQRQDGPRQDQRRRDQQDGKPRDQQPRDQQAQHSRPPRDQQRPGGPGKPGRAPERREKEIDPDSPFAVLKNWTGFR